MKKSITTGRSESVPDSESAPTCEHCGGPRPKKNARFCSLDCSRRAQRRDVAESDHHLVEELVANGVSQASVASRLGISRRQLRDLLREDADLQAAWDRGLAREEEDLRGVLYRRAVEKNCAISAMFLLKARHGYRDRGEAPVQDNRLQVAITLPKALPSVEEWERAYGPKEIGSASKALLAEVVDD